MKSLDIILSGIFLFLTQLTIGQQTHSTNLINGDLIFVGAEQKNLSGAINRVTQRDTNSSFDHIGIIEINKDSIFVLHASSKSGTIREKIQDFFKTQKNGRNDLVIFRLKQPYDKSIPIAITAAKQMLGKPYNWSYILNENSYYCSDFIERAFRSYHIFQLEPMTFINPTTGKTDDFWINFYHKQGIEVPEGKSGCNPNGLAASDKLVKIGNLML
ncbi:YiiX/YebB-like N1pC/P60 family cysteine hydrolase [Sphingobacterium faecium]|uniref:YiiX/YebB-like N1pC/P60 family cysteine hydrolase n=1 Tax=Sphingobacterium faecium TaxID=34087 RepID=UPI00246893A9|nr:YiiX/YebB-like N1pC/P60 family cysteine hydrolase [Sphingobacterium faecium]MDH5826022.1 YiiX/YebB-like N1pC/P60 family cysteine hydrolase [Sphingobacterium faecium]